MKTNRNGFLTEDGLVAFYRDFGRLGDDIEASGVRYNSNTTRGCWVWRVLLHSGLHFRPRTKGGGCRLSLARVSLLIVFEFGMSLHPLPREGGVEGREHFGVGFGPGRVEVRVEPALQSIPCSLHSLLSPRGASSSEHGGKDAH